MKEFSPINQGQLTTQPDNSKLERRGDIFMPGEPGGREIPQSPHDVNTEASSQKKPDVREAVVREGLRRTVFGKKPGDEANEEAQASSRKAWEEFYKDKKMLPGEHQIVEAIIREGGMPGKPRIEPVVAGLEYRREGQPPDEDDRDSDAYEGQEEAASRGGEARPLNHRIENYVNENRAYMDAKLAGNIDPARENSLAMERAELLKEVITIIDNAPSIESSTFDAGRILPLARHFKEVRERLINQILFRPFEDQTETNTYSLNLYADSHLEILLGYLSQDDRERYAKFISLKNGATLFHRMNQLIIAGNLGEFNSIAENVNYQHFGLMQEIPGVSQAMRLYEQTFQDILARDKRITTSGYAELKSRVRKSFTELNNSGLVKSAYASERIGENIERMQPWELERALNVGRTFFNITFRAAEMIASGQIYDKEGVGSEKSAGSFPQESAARLMNWMQLMTERFGIASTRGGVEFLHMVKAKYTESLRERGLKKGINKIQQLGGFNIDDLEIGGIFGISGIYSSWRLETMALPKLKMVDGNRTLSIREWLDEEVEPGLLRKKQIANASGSRRLELLRPLINSSDVGLGILLKQGFAADEKGYEVRKAIWERVALGNNRNSPREGNIPLIIDYLTNLKMSGGAPFIKTLDKLREGTRWANSNGQESIEWVRLREKILRQHEVNMLKAIRKTNGENIEQLTDMHDVAFDADEISLILKIKQEGAKLAPHLADIVFPYVPFMNDTPFELLDYSGPGEEFFKRRLGGDLPSYNKAQTSFIQLMNNPGAMNIEEGLKLIDGIIKGVESPQGTEDAQKRLRPLFSAWVDFLTTRPGQRQALYKSIMESLRKPTSKAQDFAGLRAPSLTEPQIRTLIDHAVVIGIITREQAEKEKKAKGTGMAGFLWSLFRDLFYVPFVATGIEFGKRVAK